MVTVNTINVSLIAIDVKNIFGLCHHYCCTEQMARGIIPTLVFIANITLMRLQPDTALQHLICPTTSSVSDWKFPMKYGVFVARPGKHPRCNVGWAGELSRQARWWVWTELPSGESFYNYCNDYCTAQLNCRQNWENRKSYTSNLGSFFQISTAFQRKNSVTKSAFGGWNPTFCVTSHPISPEIAAPVSARCGHCNAGQLTLLPLLSIITRGA